MPSEINSQTNLYGIFGNPVHHSLSPAMHNALFQKFKINAAYLAFKIEPQSLGLAFEAMRSLGLRGVNVTVPFKEETLDYIDEIPEDLDRCIGALNTVVNRDGKLLGYNTDVQGFLFSLKEDLKFNPDAKTILVIGAGGAARAVCFSLAYAHADKIWIYNRTPERAEGLKGHLQTHFPETQMATVHSPDDLKDERIDLVVNASSCGMRSQDPLAFNLKILKNKPCVYDLIYSPSETHFLREAKSLGLSSSNGLGMLAAQGAASFGLWTGEKNAVRETMLEVLKKCQL